jgi:hypothetical protein
MAAVRAGNGGASIHSIRLGATFGQPPGHRMSALRIVWRGTAVELPHRGHIRRHHWPPPSANSTVAQIAQRLGRSPATVKAYFYDPTGAKAKAVKARYVGLCRGCGAPTQPRNGKGDAYAYCKSCHPGAIAPQWTCERMRAAMRAWRDRYGTRPSSYDWSRTHASRRGGQALERLAEGDWPSPATVTDLYGTWSAACADALAHSPASNVGAGER